MHEVAKQLDLNPNRFVIFASLLGKLMKWVIVEMIEVLDVAASEANSLFTLLYVRTSRRQSNHFFFHVQVTRSHDFSDGGKQQSESVTSDIWPYFLNSVLVSHNAAKLQSQTIGSNDSLDKLNGIFRYSNPTLVPTCS